MENEKVSTETVAALAHDNETFWIAGMVSPLRVGVRLFAVQLEHEYYKPATPRNDLFKMIQIDFDEMTFIVIGIPLDERHLAELVAANVDMRISDGIPTVIDAGGIKRFAMDSDQVCTLVNARESLVYQSDPAIIGEMLENEDRKCDDILWAHKKWLDEKYPEGYVE